MLGVFAEFETNLRRERQLEGIAKAKAAPRTRANECGERFKLLWAQAAEDAGESLRRKISAGAKRPLSVSNTRSIVQLNRRNLSCASQP
jgi:DNA invertase Pin-like site-specific DNA recombinase